MEQNYSETTVLPSDWVRWQPKEGEEQPAQPCWSGKFDPPKVGEHVRVTMNGLGMGTVIGYFIEYGWLGLLVTPANPPKWWLDQNKVPKNGPYPPMHIFGVECKPVSGDGTPR